ncbi:MAG: NAD(P)-dependent oxidoreductase [Dehalococcoidia bacterium]|nr:NAD(P)-dependent oxidoreductase [Dehalococcoidia bacterium]
MSAVLVTGGSGVIGSWVVRRLVDKGERVVSYSRRPDTTLIKDIVDKVEYVSGDVLDLPRIMDTIKKRGIDRIIHLAAIMPDDLEANPYANYKINVDGTINVLEAARLMDVKRLVYTSTQGVYDTMRGEHAHPAYKPIDEHYPQAPKSVYGATKLFCEHMGLRYNRIYGVDFVALRFAWVYGPGKQARHGVLALHSKIIESAMLGKPLKIPQGGDQKVDNAYVRDVAKAIVLACFVEKPEHRVFNIGTGKGETMKHLIEVLDGVFGGAQIEIGPGLNPRGAQGANYIVMNIERARKELGYSPEFDLEAGAKDYIETMKRLGIQPMV